MFFFLSKVLDVGFSPLTWGIALCVLGAVALRRKNPGRVLRSTPIAGACVLYFFSIEPVSNGLSRRMEETAIPTVRTDVTYDAVVLLGGVVDAANGAFGQRSYNDNIERLLVTFDLLRTGRAKQAILSGGPIAPDPGAVNEADVLRAQLEDWGIARDRLVIEDRSRNTRENAVESARIVREHGWTAILIVTSAFHMQRSLECFNAVGLPVDTLAVDRRALDPKNRSQSFLPRAGSLSQSTGALRELVGRAVYRARGYATPELQSAPR